MIERLKRFLHRPEPVEAEISHSDYLLHMRAEFVVKAIELDRAPYRENTRKRVYQ